MFCFLNKRVFLLTYPEVGIAFCSHKWFAHIMPFCHILVEVLSNAVVFLFWDFKI